MAYEIPGFSFTLPAGENFANSKQFRFAAVNSNGAAVAPALGAAVVGVRQTTNKAGEATTIVNGGISMVESGDANIVAGSKIATTNVGTAKVAAANEVIVGTALDASSATGILVSVLLAPGSQATA